MLCFDVGELILFSITSMSFNFLIDKTALVLLFCFALFRCTFIVHYFEITNSQLPDSIVISAGLSLCYRLQVK